MHGTVAVYQRRRVDPRELAICILQRLGRQVWIQAHERLSQATFEHYVPVVRIAALGGRFARRDSRAVEHCIAQRLQPGEGGIFDNGF